MKTFRIKSILGDIISAEFPPEIVSAVFPGYGNGYSARSDDGAIIVTVPEGTPPPADLGPLVRVEEIPPQA